MGVKKSTVCTSAISSVILYTPASSAVEISTRRLGSCCGGSSARACPNTVGLIFDAQPAQATRLVSFHCFCLRNIALSLLCMGSNVSVPYCSASWTLLPGVFHCVRALRDSICIGRGITGTFKTVAKRLRARITLHDHSPGLLVCLTLTRA